VGLIRNDSKRMIVFGGGIFGSDGREEHQDESDRESAAINRSSKHKQFRLTVTRRARLAYGDGYKRTGTRNGGKENGGKRGNCEIRFSGIGSRRWRLRKWCRPRERK